MLQPADILKTFLNTKIEDSWAFAGVPTDTFTSFNQRTRAIVKDKNFKKLVTRTIKTEISKLGLKVIDGNKLDRKQDVTAKDKRTFMNTLRDNLMIRYNDNHCQVPDTDLVVYNPQNNQIIAIISCAPTSQERIEEIAYWKLKLASQSNTKHIKVCLVTWDKEETLIDTHNKSNTIAQNDIDTCYVISDKKFTETNNIKGFDKLLADIRESY